MIDSLQYARVHQWIVRNYGRADRCDFDPDHRDKTYHWANLTGEYIKDITHFRPLCASCHRALDSKPRTHCKKGHEYSQLNTRWNKGGYRICLVCQKQYVEKWNILNRERGTV